MEGDSQIMNIDPNWRSTDIANGPGVRVTIFVAGCRIHCPECFNKEAQNFDYGVKFTPEIMEAVLQACERNHIDGLTILGGEPMEPENQRGILPLVKAFKERCPDKTVWCYTGYLLAKDILPATGKRHTEVTDELLTFIDYIVDGPFISDFKSPGIAFRGSTNQRILRQHIISDLESEWVDVHDQFDV